MGIDKRELRNAPALSVVGGADNATPLAPAPPSAADELRALATRIDSGEYGHIVMVAGVLGDSSGQTGPFTCGLPLSKLELVGTLNLAAIRLAISGAG